MSFVKPATSSFSGDPVTVRFFLAHATRTFGPYEVVDGEGRLQLSPEDLSPASIRRAIVEHVNQKFPNRFPAYADLRIFQVSGPRTRVTDRLSREDASLVAETSLISPCTLDIAAIYVDHLVPSIPPGVKLAKDEKERNIHRAKWAHTPLDLIKNPDTVDDGHLSLMRRPGDVMVPDLSIFSPPMAYLSQALNGPDPNPDADILDAVAKLLRALAARYCSEKARYDTIVPILEEVFHVNFSAQFDVSFEPEEPEERPSAAYRAWFERKRRITPPGAHVDGAVVTAVRQGIDHACPVILQLEELMARAGDLQVTATHMKFIAHPKSTFVREETSCPAILIGISGTRVCLAYAVLVDAFIAQGIDQEWFWVGGASDQQQCDNIRNFARIVPAVRDAMERLQAFYTDLRAAPAGSGMRPPPYLPNPTPADPSTSRIGELEFRDKLSRDVSQALFRATFRGEDALVKFCSGYGTVAHDRLAHHGLAPPLLHMEALVGVKGLRMVVMAFDAGMMSAYDKYFGRALPEGVVAEVDRALDILHAKDQDQPDGARAGTGAGAELDADPRPSESLVHGDLCRENILVPRDAERHTPVWLVGFRWSGVAGHARYPATVFFDEQRGVRVGRTANEVITDARDRQMRDHLVTQYV